MPFHVRSRIPGKHELRVIHPRLPKPFYKTFDDPDEAGRVGERALVVLEKGVMTAPRAWRRMTRFSCNDSRSSASHTTP